MRKPSTRSPTVLVALCDSPGGAALAEAAAELGWSAAGPFSAGARALDYLRDDRPDFAVVGTVLADGTAIPLVSALRRGGVPFVLVAAYEPGSGRLHALESYGQGWVDAPLGELLSRHASLVAARRRAPAPAARRIAPAL